MPQLCPSETLRPIHRPALARVEFAVPQLGDNGARLSGTAAICGVFEAK